MNTYTKELLHEILMFNKFSPKLNAQNRKEFYENYKGPILDFKKDMKKALAVLDYFKANIPSSLTPELKKEFLNNLNEMKKKINPFPVLYIILIAGGISILLLLLLLLL